MRCERQNCPATRPRRSGRSLQQDRPSRQHLDTIPPCVVRSSTPACRSPLPGSKPFGLLPRGSSAAQMTLGCHESGLHRQEAAMARTAGAKRKQWNVMVYLAGDNNLDSAGVADLQEMKTIGSTDQVAIVAQFDRSGARRTTNRYVLQKGSTLAEDLVTSLGETNTGDPAVLRDFVTWAVTTQPARHYMLVIWNHGSGWDDSNLYAGDYFSGATPPVVRKGRVLAAPAGPAAGPPVRSGTVRAAIKRARRSLFQTTVASMVSS